MRSVPFAPLEPALYREAVRRALAEDLGWGAVTTEGTVDPQLRGRGVILAKSDCVIAGLDIAAEAFRQLDPAVVFTKKVEDGQRCAAGTSVAEVRGSAAGVLAAGGTGRDVDGGADGPQFCAALVRNCIRDEAFCRRDRWRHNRARHAQDDANAPGPRKIRGAPRWRVDPSLGTR